MSLFIIFIVGAVLLGAGAMLAPAWRTRQPRIALAATLALALVTGGAVFWAFLSGWDTLIVDYLLFALVSIVVLGGTLSQAQTRAEAQGDTLSDQDQGWTGPEDLLFFGLVATLFILSVVILALPLANTGITLGYHTLALRLSGQFDTLMPFHPEVGLFQPPGFIALTAYLSTQLGLSIANVQLSVSAVVALLCVWLAYDWGAELGDKRLGRAFAVVCVVSGGVWVLLVSGQYTTLLATAFLFACLLYMGRVWQHGSWWDVVGGGLLFGAVIYADFAMGIVAIVLIGVQAVALASTQNVFTAQRLGMFLASFAVTLVGIAPWLIKNLGKGNALIYADSNTVWAWLIIPITFIGGYALLQAYTRIAPDIRQRLRSRAVILMLASYALFMAIFLVGLNSLRPQSTATPDDIAVLEWANTNLPTEAVILNYRPDDWASVISQRATLAIPLLDGYQNDETAQVQASKPPIVWRDPAEAGGILREYGITHIFQPSTAPALIADYVTVLYTQGNAVLYAVAVR
jgi:hypothetical protein